MTIIKNMCGVAPQNVRQRFYRTYFSVVKNGERQFAKHKFIETKIDLHLEVAEFI